MKRKLKTNNTTNTITSLILRSPPTGNCQVSGDEFAVRPNTRPQKRLYTVPHPSKASI